MPAVTGTFTAPNQSAAPTSPATGQLYFDIDDNVLYYWNGTAWISTASSAPGSTPIYDYDQPGTIKAFSGTTIPTNWMLADGRSLVRSEYPELFTAIGTRYGTADATHFNIPDLTRKFVYGATSADLAAALATGGEATTPLTIANLPSHSHGAVTGQTGTDHVHSMNHDHAIGVRTVWDTGGTAAVLGAIAASTDAGGGGASAPVKLFNGNTGGVSANHTHPVTAEGGGTQHNNLPPYVLIAYIVKVKVAAIAGNPTALYDSDQIGTIKAFAGTVIPTNWMLADGRTLTQAAYPQLAAALGMTGSFAIPDLRNRFIYGGSVAGIGATGGAASVTLTAAESGLPSHQHFNLTRVNQSITWTTGGNYPAAPGYDTGGAAVADTAMSVAANASAAHENLPPYIKLAYIIKVEGATIDPGGALKGADGAAVTIYEQPDVPASSHNGDMWIDTDELPYAWASGIPLVSVLPASPMNGQEVYYLADATNGILWHLRYRVDSPSTYKWEYVGGPPIYSRVDTQESTTLATYTVLATAGPTIALPLIGDYLVTTGAECHCGATGNAAFMSYDIGATAAVDADCVSSYATGGAVAVNAMGQKRKNALTAVTLTMKYRVNLAGTTTYWSKRFFSVIPVRVG